MTSTADREGSPIEMTDGLRRLVNLYGLLLRAHAGEPLTLSAARRQLADQYPDYEGESGRRSFLRDRQRLEAAGVPLASSYVTDVAGAPGWWVPLDRAVLPGLELTDDEKAALDEAVTTIDFRDVLWAHLARTKLVHRPYGTRRPVAREPVGPVAEFVAPEGLPPLHEASARRHPVTFGYRGHTRAVEPYGVGNTRGHWYVVGRELTTDVVKVFRADRIAPGTVTVDNSTTFTRPEHFDLAEHLPADRWGWGDDPFEVQVAVHAEVAEILAADAGHGLARTERHDGRVQLTFWSTRRDVCIDWVLGLADRVEVLAPADLRAEVVTRLRSHLDTTAEPAATDGQAATPDPSATATGGNDAR